MVDRHLVLLLFVLAAMLAVPAAASAHHLTKTVAKKELRSLVLENDAVYYVRVDRCVRISSHKVRCRIHDRSRRKGENHISQCFFRGVVTLRGDYLNSRTYGVDCSLTFD